MNSDPTNDKKNAAPVKGSRTLKANIERLVTDIFRNAQVLLLNTNLWFELGTPVRKVRLPIENQSVPSPGNGIINRKLIKWSTIHRKPWFSKKEKCANICFSRFDRSFNAASK